ncbi:hypothetical protein TNCV_4380731 [Trichonephila clavipes]|nr:hypothetical protein TNCV_4380731 [Trichonephila clavipes]
MNLPRRDQRFMNGIDVLKMGKNPLSTMNALDELRLHGMLKMLCWCLKVRSVATAVSALSMILDPQATGVPTCVTTVQLAGLSYLKRVSGGILIRSVFRTSYASAESVQKVRH